MSRADALLGQIMTTDAVPLVRQAAVFAASFRAFGPLSAALEAVCKKEKEAGVRLSAVTTLVTLAKSESDALCSSIG